MIRGDEKYEMSLTLGRKTMKVTWDYFDVDIEDILDAVCGMCVTGTYSLEGLLESMRDYANDHLPVKYDEDEDDKLQVEVNRD